MTLFPKTMQFVPARIRQKIRLHFRVPKERKESNSWLGQNCADVKGHILSAGSEYDDDGECVLYRDYFKKVGSCTTSEVSNHFGTDIVIDDRTMPEIETGPYDAIFCSGVLEHVDDFQSGIRHLLKGSYMLIELQAVNQLRGSDLPASYWNKAQNNSAAER